MRRHVSAADRGFLDDESYVFRCLPAALGTAVVSLGLLVYEGLRRHEAPRTINSAPGEEV